MKFPQNTISLGRSVLGGGILLLVVFWVTKALTLNTFAYDTTSVDDVAIVVPTSCSFTNATTSNTYVAHLTPGNYDDTIGSTTFQVFCNDNNGYSVYAVGYSGDTMGSTEMISSDPNISNIITGTATSGNTSNWAMKLTADPGDYAPTISDGTNNTENFTIFHNVPSSYTKVATFPSITDRATGSSFHSTYLVYAKPGQLAATFTGKVRYTLFHPSNSCLYYSVHFDAGDGSGTMDSQKICQNVSTALDSVALTPPAGYEFKEWNTAIDGTGTSYANGASVTNLSAPGTITTLYAIWWQPT